MPQQMTKCYIDEESHNEQVHFEVAETDSEGDLKHGLQKVKVGAVNN